MGVISSDERKVGLHQWSEYLHKEVLTGLNRRLPRHDTPFAFNRMVLTRTIVKSPVQARQTILKAVQNQWDNRRNSPREDTRCTRWQGPSLNPSLSHGLSPLPCSCCGAARPQSRDSGRLQRVRQPARSSFRLMRGTL